VRNWLVGHRLLASAAALAVAAACAAIVVALGFRDTSNPVSVQEALERLDGRTGAPARVNGALVPETGVYPYATRGEERFEAFVSAAHVYPPTTTITVSRGGCGLLMRWSPLEERETEYDLCPSPGGFGLASFLDVHEFFGQGDRRRYLCRDGVAFKRRGDWAYTCRFEDRRDRFSGRVLGVEILRVDGRPVPTVHVRETDRLSGTEHGFGVSETWYRRGDGLIVRRIARSRDQSPVPGGGSGTYTERYELRLLSLRPAG
jgi:hypothetical protein